MPEDVDNFEVEADEDVVESDGSAEDTVDTPVAEDETPEPEPELVLTSEEPAAEVSTKKRRKRKVETVEGEVVTKRVKKAKKVKEPADLRYVFRKAMKSLDIEKLKKPWMAEKAFKLIDTEEALERWVDSVLADTSRHYTYGTETCPVLAVDTETIGLDTRVLVDIQENPDGSYTLTYEVKIEIAGICISPDGIEGIYIPINHEKGKNVPRDAARRILQRLFDLSHLVFYNAKFDREVLRLCMGINLRSYPHFEDVQSLAFINDPKADLGDKKKKYTGSSGGLKALSKTVLEMEQIDLETIGRFKADKWDEKKQKNSKREQYVPFTWIPCDVALWYAAGDAICTWLLWQRMKDLARTRRLPHRIDHELVDSLIFVERQRFLIDVDRHSRTSQWHTQLLERYYTKLRELALAAGFVEPSDEEGVVSKDDQFNPGSGPQLQKLLYKIKGYKVTHYSKKTGNPSCDADAIDDLIKEHPEDEFLQNLAKFRAYSALHPSNLQYDPKDNSARILLRQSTVAGGRLSASGGDFAEDGGLGLNPQGVKKVEPGKMWRVQGNVLKPDSVPMEEIEEHPETDLHPSCFVKNKAGEINKAPGIIKNHIGLYTGYAICLVPTCTTCAEKHGILIKDSFMDANETVNLRCLFIAPPGWTFFSVDYSNIEMRAAANCSGEPSFIKEFLEGEGDFHSLTAKNVFPEFSDPNTPPGKKKALRDLAKIINFALLYGGTSHAIFLNMKEQDPNITREDCEKMVNKYWEGVPKFAQFVHTKQEKARTEFVCETSTGRVINFLSAMEALRLRRPNDEEKQNLYTYYSCNREAEKAKKEGNMEQFEVLKGRADGLWKDPDSGVRNAMEYNKFLGKIQRIAVNAPIQGLCGDFMRIALNRLRIWVESDPFISSIFRLHTSVHDEVDFSVKNEYIPFILPRVTRLMKLRKYHTQMNWLVPIECDAEYGRSWDVDWNTTDEKKPAAWTHVDGMESYIPDEFDVVTIKNLFKALTSFETTRVEKVKSWLRENIHERAYGCVKALDKAIEKKDTKETKRVLIAMLQLHEFWKIDHTPDGKEYDATMEKLEQYEQRMGLTKANRGVMPEFGYSGAIPLDCNVVRPKIEILGEEVLPEQAEITVSDTEIKASVPDEQALLPMQEVKQEIVAAVQYSPTQDAEDDPIETAVEPSSPVVGLTEAERAVADAHGQRRNDEAVAQGREPDWKDSRGGSIISNHQDGAATEICHLKYLGITDLEEIKNRLTINNFKKADVGSRTEVRGTKMKDWAGKVKERDNDDLVVVFYRKIDRLHFRPLGWLTVGEAKKVGKWDDPGDRGKPACFVRDDQLHPLGTLPEDSRFTKTTPQKASQVETSPTIEEMEAELARLKAARNPDKVWKITPEAKLGSPLLNQLHAALGTGPYDLKIELNGKVYPLRGKKLSYVPNEFLAKEAVHA